VTRLEQSTSIGDISRFQAIHRAENTALIFNDEHLSYKALDTLASQSANGLMFAGVKKNDRICYLGTNSAHYFELIFAASKIGAVMCPINWRLSTTEVSYILEDTEAKIIFITNEFSETVNKVLEKTSRNITVVMIDNFSDWRKKNKASDPKVECGLKDDVIQLYTSGTTGYPKGVRLSNRSLLLTRERESKKSSPEWSRWHQNDVSLISMPCFHMGGTNYGLSTLYAGATGVITSQFDPLNQINFIKKYGITKQFIVPTALRIMLKEQSLSNTELESLKYISYGSSPIPLDLMESAIEKFGCKFIQKYGMTETGGSCTALSPEDHTIPPNSRMNSVGKPLNGVKLKIINSSGLEQKIGDKGEIVIQSTGNMNGYWKNSQETKKSILDGNWFKTGDVGYLDQEGYLYILDRVKDMILSGGENIYSAEVERALKQNPIIDQVAVIGVPDKKWGESVKACIVLKPNTIKNETKIISECKKILASYKCPKSIDFLTELPRSTSGKVLKRQLRKPYWVASNKQVN